MDTNSTTLEERCKLRKERFPGIQSINSLQRNRKKKKRWVRIKNPHVIFQKSRKIVVSSALGEQAVQLTPAQISTPEWLMQWGLSAVTVAWTLQCLGLNPNKEGREAPGCETFCFPVLRGLRGKKSNKRLEGSL